MTGVAPPDLVAVGVLLLFTVWGAWRGSLRQLAMLAAIVAAFPLARRVGPRLEEAVRKVMTVAEPDVRAVAWAVAFLAVLVAGGVLLAALQPLLGRLRLAGRADRVLGALLGLAHGVVFCAILLAGILLATAGGGAPAWTRSLASSRSGELLAAVATELREAAPLPPWLDERVARSLAGAGEPDA